MLEKIAIVTNDDFIIGYEDKIKVHELGILHRAFSIFIFNDKNELLLQKRAANKYHSSSLWSNTCCSHLRFDEIMENAAHCRLKVEMGLNCNLKFIKKFSYKTSLINNLIENEIDYLYIGYTNTNPIINTNEVSDYKWIDLCQLKEEIKLTPFIYTYWLKEIVKSNNFF
jgi:isopentenyl-diphosphate delta-isomerase